MDWRHWVPGPLHLKYPQDGKIQLSRGWGERHFAFKPKAWVWALIPLQLVVLWAVRTTLQPPQRENNFKKGFKNSTCYFWFSPNLTLNNLLWIWRLSDNINNQYINAACIIYGENHMGGRRNHFWLQYMGRTSSSWGQSVSHHHLRRSLKHLCSLPWQQEMLQNHSYTANAYGR